MKTTFWSLVLSLFLCAGSRPCPPESLASWFTSHPPWYRCGAKVLDTTGAARDWIGTIEASCDGESNCIRDLIGIAWSESRFDECAVGQKFRRWAASTLAPSSWPWKIRRRLGDRMIVLSQLTISLPREDSIRALAHKDVRVLWEPQGVDLGPCQRYLHRWDEKSLERTLSLAGLYACADHWRAVGGAAYWPGARSEKYLRKIEKNANAICGFK